MGLGDGVCVQGRKLAGGAVGALAKAGRPGQAGGAAEAWRMRVVVGGERRWEKGEGGGWSGDRSGGERKV